MNVPPIHATTTEHVWTNLLLIAAIVRQNSQVNSLNVIIIRPVSEILSNTMYVPSGFLVP